MFRSLILTVCLACGAGLAWAEDRVTVFAAASLKTALDEVAAAYTGATGVHVTMSYAGSSALARQITFGAPADVFISASIEWMDVVGQAQLLQHGTRRDLLRNTLVLIAHGQADQVEITRDLDLPGLLGEGRLAMALVDAVPAGQYGREALSSLGVWPAVAPRIAQVDNVRAALALVSLGEAPLGIVYATDARAAGEAVTVVGNFPPRSHRPIIYPAAAIKGSISAVPFLDWVQLPEASAIFERHGFDTIAR